MIKLTAAREITPYKWVHPRMTASFSMISNPTARWTRLIGPVDPCIIGRALLHELLLVLEATKKKLAGPCTNPTNLWFISPRL